MAEFSFLRISSLAALVLATVSCTPIHYDPGEAPPLMCRGDQAHWRLAWRENTRSEAWREVGEHRWAEWVTGQEAESKSSGPIVNRVRNWDWGLQLYVEDAAGSQVALPARFREVSDCVFMDDSGQLLLYASHIVDRAPAAIVTTGRD